MKYNLDNDTRAMLFSAPMVRALLDGTKTQTRRVLKQASGQSLSVDYSDGVAELSWLYGDGPGHDVHEKIKLIKCPHGKPGDGIWGREAWRSTGDGGRCNDMPPRDMQPHKVWYEADGQAPWDECVGKLRPSMFMPRWASRLTLEITDIRVELLQDISEADAIAEGVQCSALEKIQARNGEWAKRAYRLLWEQINGPGSWDINPWVWVYTVKKV